jgi:hypothetical protein
MERQRITASVFVFNPFAEGFIARGKAFTPVKHQAMLAEDLANLPQFLCEPHDIVLLEKRPSAGFLNSLKQAGFPPPEFVQLKGGRIDPANSICQRELGKLRPWGWAPDSVELFEPLFGRVVGKTQSADQCFNEGIARLYSKVWSAGFLRKVLARCGGGDEAFPGAAEAQIKIRARDADSDEVSDKDTDEVCHEVHVAAETLNRPGMTSGGPWLCCEAEVGVAVDNIKDALEAVAAIRRRGHHRVIVKEAYSVAGQNSIRLWEPEILPAQRQWLANALEHGHPLVVESWLERELDFSVQLEMEPGGLNLCGYTGLVNDRKGQFLANWAEPDYARCLPAKAAALLHAPADISGRLERLFSEIFSLLEAELQRAGFLGPVSLDAMVYRAPEGDCRLKPVVEINPRYTMGRVTVELMKHVSPGRCGRFRLVARPQARKAGFADLASYARSLGERFPLRLDRDAKIRQGSVCLNDPNQAQVVLATFEVGPTLVMSGGKLTN